MMIIQVSIEIDESTGRSAVNVSRLEREDANDTERGIADAFEETCTGTLREMVRLMGAEGVAVDIREIAAPGPRAHFTAAPGEGREG